MKSLEDRYLTSYLYYGGFKEEELSLETEEIVLYIWIGLGGICWIGMQIFGDDEDSSSILFGVFIVLLGPIFLLWAALSSLGEISSTSKMAGSRETAPSRPEKTDDELQEDYKKLVSSLESIFVAEGPNEKTISKSNIASAQQLGALARKTAVKSIVDKSAVIVLLEKALGKIDIVYGQERTGSARKTSIQTHIDKLSGKKATKEKKQNSAGNKQKQGSRNSQETKRKDSIGFNLKRKNTGETAQPNDENSSSHKHGGGEDRKSKSSLNPEKKGKYTVDVKY
mgnify:CR=1 FL=1